jgi:hypothetical protein
LVLPAPLSCHLAGTRPVAVSTAVALLALGEYDAAAEEQQAHSECGSAYKLVRFHGFSLSRKTGSLFGTSLA